MGTPGQISFYAPTQFVYNVPSGPQPCDIVAIDGCLVDLCPRVAPPAGSNAGQYARDYLRVGIPQAVLGRLIKEVKAAMVVRQITTNADAVSLDWRGMVLHGEHAFGNIKLGGNGTETFCQYRLSSEPELDVEGDPVMDSDGNPVSIATIEVGEPELLGDQYSNKMHSSH